MRKMYDTAHPTLAPIGGDLYMGYTDGRWPSYAALCARFGADKVVPVTTDTRSNRGIVGDGPTDNGSWPGWVTWVKRRRAAGTDPTMYTNAANWTAGKAAFRAANVPEPHWGIAAWPGGGPTIPPGAVFHQYASVPGYDTSVVADYWPGVDGVINPAVPTGPPTQGAPTTGDENVHTERVVVKTTNGHGEAPLPVPADKIRGVWIEDQNPRTVGQFPPIPTGVAIASQPSPTAPNGVVVLAGGADRTWGVTLSISDS